MAAAKTATRRRRLSQWSTQLHLRRQGKYSSAQQERCQDDTHPKVRCGEASEDPVLRQSRSSKCHVTTDGGLPECEVAIAIGSRRACIEEPATSHADVAANHTRATHATVADIAGPTTCGRRSTCAGRNCGGACCCVGCRAPLADVPLPAPRAASVAQFPVHSPFVPATAGSYGCRWLVTQLACGSNCSCGAWGGRCG